MTGEGRGRHARMGWQCLGNLAIGSMLAMPWLGGACNFDSAFQHYCQNNPQCQADAATAPEAGPDAEPGSGSDASFDAGPPWGSGPDSGPGGPPPIWPPWSCLSSADCGPNQVCHPFGFVCMSMCNTSADCPPWLDTCAEIIGPAGNPRTPKVCTCTASQTCDSYASGFRCNPTDNLCEQGCYATQDCYAFQPPRVCDQFANVCRIATPPCFSNANCPSATQPHCDPGSAQCVGCIVDADCASRVDGLTQCSSSGSCVSPSS